MTNDVPFNPAFYVSVILHCESLADKLFIGMFVDISGKKLFSEQQWDFITASTKTSLNTNGDGPAFIGDINKSHELRD